MGQKITIKNMRPSRLDLSHINDSNGMRVILEPRDQPGSTRQIPESALEHVDVKSFFNAQWIEIEGGGDKFSAMKEERENMKKENDAQKGKAVTGTEHERSEHGHAHSMNPRADVGSNLPPSGYKGAGHPAADDRAETPEGAEGDLHGMQKLYSAHSDVRLEPSAPMPPPPGHVHPGESTSEDLSEVSKTQVELAGGIIPANESLVTNRAVADRALDENILTNERGSMPDGGPVEEGTTEEDKMKASPAHHNDDEKSKAAKAKAKKEEDDKLMRQQAEMDKADREKHKK